MLVHGLDPLGRIEFRTLVGMLERCLPPQAA